MRSIFTSWVPLPSARIMVTVSSTEAYFKEQRPLDIPSLTLLPAGVERPTMLVGLGMCIGARSSGEMGTSRRPADISAKILSVTMEGLARQDG